MIYNILQELASDNSRNFKLDVLKKHQNNELLKRVCFLTLDPFTQFFQRKIPAYSVAQANQADSLSSALDSLALLSTRQVTGNAAINHLTKVLSSLTAEDANVVERVIQKDLKCGVSGATVNRVWPELIHDYPCMLAAGFDQKLIDRMAFPAYVQLKLDGLRANAIVRNGVVEFRSRNGKEIHINDPEFADTFVRMADGSDMVFDGELLIRGLCGQPGEFLDRQTGNGILNKAVKGTISDDECHTICMTLWDAIPFDDFMRGVHKTPYSIRLEKLNHLVEGADDRVSAVWTAEANDLGEVQSHFQRFLSFGQEGIILKSKDMIWENKRSKNQIKFKDVRECELRVVGIQEGTGKYAGMIGALLCESEDGVVQVSVGTGLKDDDRMKDVYSGKIVSVKYNQRIKNKAGEHSLFLPVFVEVREDKDVADHSSVIE